MITFLRSNACPPDVRQSVLAVCLVVSSACTEANPNRPTPTPPAAQQVYTVSGTITAASGGSLNNATVRVEDGGSAGKTANTDGSGRYSLTNVAFGGFTIGVTAPGYIRTSRGISLVLTQPSFTANFNLLPEAPWTRSGVGNTVWDMPTYFARVHIVGMTTSRCENFVARIGGRLVINEILGTCSVATAGTRYEGLHLTSGGVVEITNSVGVSWTFTESR